MNQYISHLKRNYWYCLTPPSGPAQAQEGGEKCSPEALASIVLKIDLHEFWAFGSTC